MKEWFYKNNKMKFSKNGDVFSFEIGWVWIIFFIFVIFLMVI